LTDLPSPAAPAGEPAARRTYRFAFDVEGEATLAPEPGEDLAGLSRGEAECHRRDDLQAHHHRTILRPYAPECVEGEFCELRL
jgi:hypothetical protein